MDKKDWDETQNIFKETMNSIKSELKRIHVQADWMDSETTLRMEINDVRMLIRDLTDMTSELAKVVEIQQNTECKCKCDAWERRVDRKSIVHLCQYHRSIAFVHDELIAISKLMEREYIKAGRELIIDLLLFLDECKKNSFTDRVGKARDENIGR